MSLNELDSSADCLIVCKQVSRRRKKKNLGHLNYVFSRSVEWAMLICDFPSKRYNRLVYMLHRCRIIDLTILKFWLESQMPGRKIREGFSLRLTFKDLGV